MTRLSLSTVLLGAFTRRCRLASACLALALLLTGCNAIAVPPTSATVVTPPADPPPLVVPPLTPVELLLSPGSGDNYAGEGLSLRAIPIKGEVFAPAVYQWTFGDGGTETTETNFAGHVYQERGEYPASVHVRDRDGRTAEASTVIVVTRRPSPPRDPTPPPSTCPTVTLSPSTLPSGTVGTNYSRTAVSRSGKAPYSFAVSLVRCRLGCCSRLVAWCQVLQRQTRRHCCGSRDRLQRVHRLHAPTRLRLPIPPDVLIASMSCRVTSTISRRVSCNMSGTFNGAPVPTANISNVDWDWGDGETESTAQPAQTHDL